MERLQEQFNTSVVPALKEKFKFKNVMEVPKIVKVVINVGVGKIAKDAKAIDVIMSDVAAIAGQAPVKTLARKSIAGFKVRENQVVGVTVTLRGYRMYSFLDKLINVALPRVRDFQGVSQNSFDGRGNYHLGLREHIVFPEVATSGLEHIFGMEISVVTNSGSDEVTKELLANFGFPFKK